MNFEEKVKKIAYELYEKNGRREGRDLLDWLAAEQIIRFQQIIFPGMREEEVGLLEYKPMSGSVPALALPEKLKTRSRQPSVGRRQEAEGKAS